MDRAHAVRAVVTAWALSIAAGVYALDAWALRGAVPQGAATAEVGPRARLWLFLHPECPCSRATLAQLEALMPRLVHRPDVTVWMVGAARRERSALAARAALIPGVEVRDDVDGRRAAAEGAALSGHAVWIDADGTVRFRGGLTAERGHAGASTGGEAVLALASQRPVEHTRTPVFGCDLGVTSP